MLSWIATPGSASVHVDLMQAQVPDATTLAKFRHSLKARGVRQSYALRLNLELKKAGITARGGSMVDATFTWALKLHEEQGPCARPLKRISPRKGRTGVSDTRRIAA